MSNIIELNSAVSRIGASIKEQKQPALNDLNMVYNDIVKTTAEATNVLIHVENYSQICKAIITHFTYHNELLPLVSVAQAFINNYNKIIDTHKITNKDEIDKELAEYKAVELARIKKELVEERNKKLFEIDEQVNDYRAFRSQMLDGCKISGIGMTDGKINSSFATAIENSRGNGGIANNSFNAGSSAGTFSYGGGGGFKSITPGFQATAAQMQPINLKPPSFNPVAVSSGITNSGFSYSPTVMSLGLTNSNITPAANDTTNLK